MLKSNTPCSESRVRQGQGSEQGSVTLNSPAVGNFGHGEKTILQIDLRVNGVPNDETCKDKKYMQKITKQVKKLVETQKSLKEESLESNILSEEAAKKIYGAGTCELHEVQPRTYKIQCQRCQTYVEAGFQVCPCG